MFDSTPECATESLILYTFFLSYQLKFSKFNLYFPNLGFAFFDSDALKNELITLYYKQNKGLFSGSGVTDVLKNLINNDL